GPEPGAPGPPGPPGGSRLDPLRQEDVALLAQADAGQPAHRGPGHRVTGEGVEDPLVAGAVEPVALALEVDGAGEVRALLAEGHEAPAGEVQEHGLVVRVGVAEVDHPALGDLAGAGDRDRRRLPGP